MTLGTTNDIARTALTKLLCKLKLVDEAFVRAHPAPTGANRLGPLAYYASLGSYDEKDAMELVGARLSLAVCGIEREEAEQCVRLLDDAVIAKVPLDRWRQLRAIPVGRAGGTNRLRVAVANPLDQEVKATVEFGLGEPVEIVIAPEGKIISALSRRATSDLTPLLGQAASDQLDASSLPSATSEVSAVDPTAPTVVRLLNRILVDATDANASDIHMSPSEKNLSVKIRVDGVMRDLTTIPTEYSAAVVSRLKLLAGLDIAERRKPQDGRLRIQTGTGRKDIRLSTVPTLYGESVVARLLSEGPVQATLEALGMDDETRARFEHLLQGSARVVLVTGPTGSGKTSTLYASILLANDGKTNIISIEDPIEYRIEGITQLQVQSKGGLTFANALRSVLRQDPDVVVIGEIRDGETATIAMQAAQTGHLVLSTLHTNTAASAITRLADLGVQPYLVSSSLAAVLAQRLVRRLCVCSVPAGRETRERLTVLGIRAAEACEPVGCEQCAGTGYRGRVGVYSLLSVDDTVRELVRNRASEHEIEEAARALGFRSLQEAAIQLVERGVTALAEVERSIGALTPVAQAKPSGPAHGAPHERALRSKPKLLLVEDDENMRTILTMIFERAAYEVLEAPNGKVGLDVLYAEHPDIIVSDLMMPTMDAREMISIIRHRPDFQHVPILVLTAADSEDNEVLQLTTGADDFVSKTADKRVLLARVENLLARAKAEG